MVKPRRRAPGAHPFHHHVIKHQAPAQHQVKSKKQRTEHQILNEQGADQQTDDRNQIAVQVVVEFRLEYKAGEQDEHQEPDREVQNRWLPYKINQGQDNETRHPDGKLHRRQDGDFSIQLQSKTHHQGRQKQDSRGQGDDRPEHQARQPEPRQEVGESDKTGAQARTLIWPVD